MYWPLLGILFALCALMCAVGFYKFTYFLSIGYGFAIAASGIAILIMYLVAPSATPLWIVLMQMILFVLYGARLSGFLLYREYKNAVFSKSDVRKETLAKNSEKKMPVFVMVVIWLCVSALYVAQASPMLFRCKNGAADVVLPLIGAAISVAGLVLESLADLQKSAQKKERPDMVAMKGLYRIVRCPNYFGEILFWTGVFVAALTALKGAGQWIMAVIAYICIVYIMFNGAQRLERRQMKRYGDNEEYAAYVNKTPIILPLIPIYHLNKKKEEKEA